MCVFCSHPEFIQHLFFEYHFAKFIWGAVEFTFNIEIPISVVHLFNGWANSAGPQLQKFLFIGASALCWGMWTSRNNIVFDNSPSKTYMQVLYRGKHWLRLWAQLQRREENTNMMKEACQSLERMVMHIFVYFRWGFCNRIEN
jgi:hypothetical protein